MKAWWLRIRNAVKLLIVPLIGLQFVQTLVYPHPLEVLVLFGLFVVFLGLLMDWI